jgi:hypothetical protein
MIHDVCVQEYFRCEDGKQARAQVVLENAYHSRLRDLYHEARIQCIIKHYRNVLGEAIDKQRVRQDIVLERETDLTEEEYLRVSKQETFILISSVKHSIHLLTCQILDVS